MGCRVSCRGARRGVPSPWVGSKCVSKEMGRGGGVCLTLADPELWLLTCWLWAFGIARRADSPGGWGWGGRDLQVFPES